MSKSEQKIALRHVQMELPWSVLPSHELRAGSVRRHDAISEALKAALNDCGLGRDTVADELSRLTGDKITVNHLNNWCAESKNGWRLPLEYTAALTAITQDTRIVKAALEGTGMIVLDEDERDFYELGKLTAENRVKTRKRNQIFGRLGI